MEGQGRSEGGPVANGIRPAAHDAERLAAFRSAYREHSSAVHAVACWLCSPATAHEVTCRVFARLWNRPQLYHPVQPSLRTALLTLAHREARKAGRSETAADADEPRADVSTSSGGAESDERTARIQRALDALPHPERVAIATTYFGRCSYHEAAVVLGEPEATIKARISAALRKLPGKLAALHAT